MDYLMVHDADEFYFHEDFEKLKKIVFDNPDYDSYITKLCVFWKSFKYILVAPKCNEYSNGSFYAPGGRISGIAETVVNLNHNLAYNNIRLVSGYNRYMVDIVYYHGSYVLNDEEVLRKINTLGHKNDFDGEKWYKEKWLNWTLETKNLHPMSPREWLYAEEFNEELPEVLC